MCLITLTSLVFNETDETLTLSGTSDCAGITVAIVSPNLTTEVGTRVNADTTWDAVYVSTDLLLPIQTIVEMCGRERFKVAGHCTEDPDCKIPKDAGQNLVLECERRSGTCPMIKVLDPEIEPCVEGLATVTFPVDVANAPDPLIYEIVFGDGEDQTVVFDPTAPNPNGISHIYPAGSFTVVVNVVFPENCPPSNEVNFAIDCDPVPPTCPTLDLRLVSLVNCDSKDGRKSTATFAITVTGAPETDCVYEIDYGDGEDENITFDADTPNPITKTHEYSSGVYSVVVNSVLPQGCESSNTVRVEAPKCTKDCPDDMDFEVIDSSGRRFKIINSAEGILEAIANNPDHIQIRCLDPGSYTLRITSPDPEGVEAEITWREGEDPPQVTNLRDFPFAVGEGETVSITATIDLIGTDCTVLSETVRLEGCSKYEDCCPDLDDLSATCMTRCPPSTTVVLTATGTDLDCAEEFHWDFGDGDTAETQLPTVLHTYPSSDRFDAEVTMIRPGRCKGDRIQQARQVVMSCAPSCFCFILAIVAAFLLLGLLSILPIIACTSDPATKQILIVILIAITVLLIIAWLWWLLDPCCRPTPCEYLRILFWVLTWALIVVGALAFLGFCVSAIPFGLVYVVFQQIVLSMINGRGCVPGAPSAFEWPFRCC